MRRRCGWCGTQLKWWQLNLCRDCKRDFADEAAKPKHKEASRWERWLEERPEPVEYRDVELPPTTTELENPEYEGAEGAISLRWAEIEEIPEDSGEIDENEEKTE